METIHVILHDIWQILGTYVDGTKTEGGIVVMENS